MQEAVKSAAMQHFEAYTYKAGTYMPVFKIYYFLQEVGIMPKWCFNYDSGEYEYIDSNGFSLDRGEFVYNWDDSQYRQE